MAYTSAGFDGTVNELQFADMGRAFGGGPTVKDAASWAASQVARTRTVRLAAGTGYSPAVRTVTDTTSDVVLAVPAAGQWYAIVLERNWTTNAAVFTSRAGQTTTTAVPTTAPTALPGTLNTNPGVLEDQIVAWAWVNNANTTMVLIDTREILARTGHLYPVASSDMQRDAKFLGALTSHARCERTDLKWIEEYRDSGVTVNGWYPVEGDTPGLTAKTVTLQSIGGSATTVTFGGTATVAVRGGLGFVAGTGVVTVTKAGVYRVTGQVSFNAGTNGSRVLGVYVNGAAVLASIQVTAVIATVNVSADVTVAVGDTITLAAISTGAAVNIGVGGNAYNQKLDIEYLAAA